METSSQGQSMAEVENERNQIDDQDNADGDPDAEEVFLLKCYTLD
jgi:hypothetical protein